MDEIILSRIRQEAYEQGYQDGKVDGYNLAETRISSAKQEWKRGKWNFIGDNMFQCTYCGSTYTSRQLEGLRDFNTDPYTPRFCPNCGSYNGEESDNG